MRKRYPFIATLLLGTSVPALAQTAQQPMPASPPAAAPAQAEEAPNEIVVVGSNIRGAKVTGALNVTVIDQTKIDATGAVSGDELIRSIPQFGEVSFNPSNNAQTSNAARGDVGSIDLRGLGVGNTLVLINGRRTVTNAGSQALSDNGTVPVLSYNSNAIPTTGLQRLEVLLDGAAALYGSDAVAGVVNTVIRDNYRGVRTNFRFGGGEGTNFGEIQADVTAGTRWKTGSVTAIFEYTQRYALRATDQNFTATDDLRPLFDGTPFAGNTTADNRATRGTWPALMTNIQVRQGTRTLTTAAGAFNIRPVASGPCSAQLPNAPQDICLVNTTLATTGAFRNLRYDTAPGTTVIPDLNRYNFFLSGKQELSDGIEAFTELGFYYSDTNRVQPPVINLNPIWIPATNFWNPFGPTTLANGQANPNRIPGLTNVPAAGLPVRLTNYRFVDAGPQTVNVKGTQARALLGLRGETLGFKWDGALLYSQATSLDRSFAVRSSALQRSLALQTSDAYNPFNGGCVATPSFGDCTPSSQAAINAIGFTLRRFSKSTLAMIDFRASNANLFELPGGAVGLAFGAEGRRESQKDDRDAAVDGSTPFVDQVTGEVTVSDAAAVSDNPDTSGSRTIGATYIEAAVPLVSPEMGIPLIRRLDLQLAGRYEYYSDFGSVAKPKFAGAWEIVEGFKVRSSYSEGFRAPNLEQTNATQYSRLATNLDFYRCEADVRARRITDFTRCGQNDSFARRTAGNPNLQAEQSQNINVGGVFTPTFLPPALGQFTLTVDYWQIRQQGIVGVLGNATAVAQDYLARLGGQSNPNVIRAAPSADDIAFFAGTGLQPVGEILALNDQFRNLLPQTVRGIDVNLYWTIRTSRIGTFDLSMSGTRLLEYTRPPSPDVDALAAARAAGQINAGTPLPETADLIEADGRPKWRATGTLTWSLGRVQIGAFARYTGKVNETGFVDATGTAFVIRDQITGNIYAQYRFGDEKQGVRVRFGVRNLADTPPPLSSSGFNGFLYSPLPRYFYGTVSKAF